MLENQWEDNKFVCVGLDPDLEEIVRYGISGVHTDDVIYEFNTLVIEETAEVAAAYKLNLGFYMKHVKHGGMEALLATIEYVHQHTSAPVILDCKVGDIESTTVAYAQAYFEEFDVDAVTAYPMLGKDALEPLIRYIDKGILILCHTSNPGSADMQDVPLMSGMPYYVHIAQSVRRWNSNGNAGLVVGATYPEQITQARKAMGHAVILIPGAGDQGGDVPSSVRAAQNVNGKGFLVNASRSICYPADRNPYGAAHALHQEIISSL